MAILRSCKGIRIESTSGSCGADITAHHRGARLGAYQQPAEHAWCLCNLHLCSNLLQVYLMHCLKHRLGTAVHPTQAR